MWTCQVMQWSLTNHKRSNKNGLSQSAVRWWWSQALKYHKWHAKKGRHNFLKNFWWCSAADTHLKLLDRVVSGACFLAGGVLNCNLSHRRSVAVLCMLYKIRLTRCTHFVALYLCLMCQSRLHAVLWSHIGILMRLTAAEPRSTTGLLFSFLYLSGTIWLTPHSMVWNWRVSRAGPMPFCWPSCSLPFCLQLFSRSLLFLYRLVVWGWGFRTDRVSISLSWPCIANFF